MSPSYGALQEAGQGVEPRSIYCGAACLNLSAPGNYAMCLEYSQREEFEKLLERLLVSLTHTFASDSGSQSTTVHSEYELWALAAGRKKRRVYGIGAKGIAFEVKLSCGPILSSPSSSQPDRKALVR